MAELTCIDVDQILQKWGEAQMSDGYTLASVDATGVQVQQMSVIYRSSKDWFSTKNVHEEFFDNNEGSPVTWEFKEQFASPCQSSWTLVKGYKSTLLSATKIALEFPVAEDGKHPLKVVAENAVPSLIPKTAQQAKSELTVKTLVTVKPYSTTRVGVVMRVCNLDQVLFTTDVHMWGTVKATGQKKRKPNKVATANIEDVLRGNPSFTVIVPTEEDFEAYGTEMCKVSYRVEGFCSGEVAMCVETDLSEIQTLV